MMAVFEGLLYISVVKHHDLKHVGEERVHLTDTSMHQSITEESQDRTQARQEPRVKSYSRGQWRKSYFLGVGQPSRTSSPREAPLAIGWAIQHQSLM